MNNQKLAKQNKKIWSFGILYTLVELRDFKFQSNLVRSLEETSNITML
jgi:hypothetical protein